MDDVKLLSGQELVTNAANKTNISLPIKGLKNIVSINSLVEAQQIKECLEKKEKLLQDQRIEKRNSLSVAEWDENLQKAHVVIKKGPHWSHIGHTFKNKIYIYPEEALHLMEIGALLMKFKGVPASIQQAYDILLMKSISLDEYRVYSLLSRDGYRLIRHENTKKIFETITKNSSCKSTRVAENDNFRKTENKTSTKPTLSTEIMKNVVKMIPDSNKAVMKKTNKCNRKRKRDEEKYIHNAIKKSKTVTGDNVPFDRMNILDSIVNCFEKKIIYMNIPNQTLLPSNIILMKKQYAVKLEKYEISESKNEDFSLNEFSDEESIDVQTVAKLKHSNSDFRNVENYYKNSDFRGNEFNCNYAFMDHVYKQISMKHSNYTFSSNDYRSFSNFENVVCDENQSSSGIGVKTEFPSILETNENIFSDKYSQLLRTVKSFLSSYKSDNEIHKNTLSHLVDEYNSLFQSEFRMSNSKNNKYSLKNQEVGKKEDGMEIGGSVLSEPINLLNCNIKKSHLSMEKIKEKREKIISNNLSRTSKNLKNNRNWFENIWIESKNKIEKPNIFQSLHETNIFFDSIKQLSSDENLESWKQTKSLYREKFTCINIHTSEHCKCYLLDHSFSLSKEYIKTDKVHPLVKPEDCKNVSSVLEKLQIFKSSAYSDNEKIDITFDVYLPSCKNFRKSSPCMPNYFLIILKSTSSLPHPRKLDFIRSRIPNNVKILFAIVSFDSVFFLEMENIFLPILDKSCENKAR